MPQTEQVVVRLLKKLTNEIAVPKDPLPIDEAIQQVRSWIASVPYTSTRVAVVVWLLERLTTKEPQITTVISTLNHDSLKEAKLSQAQTISIIEVLLRSTSHRRYSILSKAGGGNRLKINPAVIKQMTK